MIDPVDGESHVSEKGEQIGYLCGVDVEAVSGVPRGWALSRTDVMPTQKGRDELKVENCMGTGAPIISRVTHLPSVPTS